MKGFIQIITEDSNRYIVNSKGEITRYNPAIKPTDHQFSGEWLLKAICHVKKTTFSIPFDGIKEDRISKINLLYKNGRGQFSILDIDHGTTRFWGNRIKAIIFLETNQLK